MAVFNGTIRSTFLAMDTQISVILPYDRSATKQQTPCKTLYLLHGLGENSTAWCRYSAVELYARKYGVCVIMPEVQRSFYTDMQKGLCYFSYVSEELPRLATKLFNISHKREDTYIAGLSMGGYGAIRCALTHPEHYEAAASFSGALDLHNLADTHPNNQRLPEYQAIFGDELKITDHEDILKLAENVAALPQKDRPRIMLTCGKQDFLYFMNLDVKGKFFDLGLNPHWESWAGEHDWHFFDESLRRALVYFFGEVPEPEHFIPS